MTYDIGNPGPGLGQARKNVAMHKIFYNDLEVNKIIYYLTVLLKLMTEPLELMA
jgi:hypothetical protein